MRASVVLLAGIFIFSAACTKSDGENTGPNHPEQEGPSIFVNGDPRDLVNGAVFNKKSIFTKKNLSSFSNFTLSHVSIFVDKTKYQSAAKKAEEENMSPEELVRKRKASEENVLLKSSSDDYKWKSHSDNYYTFMYEPTRESSGSRYEGYRIKFQFKEYSDGRLELESFSDEQGEASNTNSYPVEVLNYSLHESGKSLSILFYMRSDSFRGLFQYTFHRKSVGSYNINKKLAPYTLMFGPKVEMRWPQTKTLRLFICGVTNAAMLAGIREGIEVWRRELSGRLDIKDLAVSQCPPYSDLNTHIIRLAEQYKMARTGAFALAIPGIPEQGIIDGDIQILINPSELISDGTISLERIRAGFLLITAHEVGHLLGLDHQYETNSIMNYNWDYFNTSDSPLTSYDIEAIQTLYPLRSQGSQTKVKVSL